MELIIPPSQVKRYRKKKGLSIEELAREIGWTPAYIENLESGNVNPPFSRLMKITKALREDLPYKWKFEENLEFVRKVYYKWTCPQCGNQVEGETEEDAKDRAKKHVFLQHEGDLNL